MVRNTLQGQDAISQLIRFTIVLLRFTAGLYRHGTASNKGGPMGVSVCGRIRKFVRYFKSLYYKMEVCCFWDNRKGPLK